MPTLAAPEPQTDRFHINFDPGPTVKRFFRDRESNYIFLEMGLGGGKTKGLVMRAMLESYLNRGFPGAILCPSYADWERDVLPELESALFDNELDGHVVINKSKYWIQFPWTSKKCYIASAEKQIKGPTWGYLLVNEHSSIPPEVLIQACGRVRARSPHPVRVFCGTTEDEYACLEDLTERWKGKNPDKVKIYSGSTRENAHNLDPGYIEFLENTYDEQARLIFIEGKRVPYSQQPFYYKFTEANIREVPRPERRGRGWDRLIKPSLDFNVGNMSTVVGYTIGEGDEKELFIYDEIVQTDRDSDTYSMGNAIKDKFGNESVLLSCDATGKNRQSAGSSDLAILKGDFEFEVRMRSANPRVRRRQLLVNGLFFHQRIWIDPRCKLTIKDLQKTQQDPSFGKSKANEELTHLSDCLDYLVDFEFPFNSKYAASRSKQYV